MCFQTSPRAAHSDISEALHKVAQWERFWTVYQPALPLGGQWAPLDDINQEGLFPSLGHLSPKVHGWI